MRPFQAFVMIGSTIVIYRGVLILVKCLSLIEVNVDLSSFQSAGELTGSLNIYIAAIIVISVYINLIICRKFR